MSNDPTIKIRTGVPLPSKQSARHLPLPFEGMQVGESFIVPDDGGTMEGRLRSACSRYGKKWGKIFSCRKIDNNTFGIWRTE